MRLAIGALLCWSGCHRAGLALRWGGDRPYWARCCVRCQRPMPRVGVDVR